MKLSQENVQTTHRARGRLGDRGFQADVPGTFILVDHALFRAFNKGALGMLKVSGEPNLEIYSGKQVDDSYLSEKVASLAPVSAAAKAKAAGTLTKEQQIVGRPCNVPRNLFDVPPGEW